MHQKERTEPKEATIATMGNAFSALAIEDKLEVTTSFHLFPRFPTEIRFQIWRRAIEELPGRIVTVREVFTGKGKNRTSKYLSTRPHPELSIVNLEARIAVFECLTPLFQPGTGHDFITVCLEKDTLLWDACSSSLFNKVRDLERFAEVVGLQKCWQIRRLAVEIMLKENEGIPSVLFHFIRSLMSQPTTHLIDMFPMIQTLVYMPIWKRRTIGADKAKFHRGELRLLPLDPKDEKLLVGLEAQVRAVSQFVSRKVWEPEKER